MKKKNFMKPIIIIGILLIPLIYSFFYLDAFWDPYGKTENIPVAIVNLDKGKDDENLGEELIDEIKQEEVLQINIEDEETAKEKLINKEYYAVITIPEDFTESINGASESDRKSTYITYSPNQKTNYLASQIIGKVVDNIELKLQKQVSTKVVDALVEKLNSVPNDMSKISDAAAEIKDGTTDLKNGTEKINTGANTLDENYEKFSDGLNTVTNGSNTLETGITALDDGIDDLYNGTSGLKDSLEQLKQLTVAIGSLSPSTENLKSGANDYITGVNNLCKNIDLLLSGIIAYGDENQVNISTDKNLVQIYETAKQIKKSGALENLTSSGDKLIAGLETLDQGITKISGATEQLPELSKGIDTLQQALQQLKDGSTKVRDGVISLKSGLTTLNQNSSRIKDGIQELSSGTSSALEGSKKLLNGVTTFENEIDDSITDTKQELEKLEGLSEYVETPVEINEEPYAQVDEYGIVFAPYFMSLSLWVGALILFVVLYYDMDNRFKLLGKNADNKILRAFLYLLLAIAQAIILGFILKQALGFTVTNEWLYYMSCILISTVFLSIIQFLIVNFNDVGKFLAILLLIFQLTASGGTFPIETTPEFFQNIYPYMPMHYSVDLIKESIITIDNGLIGNSVGVLVGFLITTILFTILFDIIKIIKKWIIKRKENAKEMKN